MSEKRSFTLDAMRGVTALAVVTSHIGLIYPPPLKFSYMAVDFFFMLSGFVLARAYEHKLKASLTAFRFMELRFVRLYPMFLLGATLGLAAAGGQIFLHRPQALAPAHAAFAFAANLFMLPDIFSHDLLFTLNGPTWTLFVEMVVNAVFALLLFRLRSVFLIGISLACAAVYFWGYHSVGSGNIGWAWNTILFGLARSGFAFPVGVVLGRAFKATDRPATLWALLPMVLLTWILFIGPPARFAMTYNAVALLLLLPATVWLGASLQPPKALRGLCERLGDVSYPFFAIHYPLLHLHLLAMRLNLPGWAFITVFVPALTLMSWLVLHQIDLPARRWLSGRSRLSPSAMPVTVEG